MTSSHPCRFMMAAAAALLMSSSANATLVTIVNDSFETPVLADNAFAAGSFAGWTVVGAAGVWNPPVASFPGGAPDGSNVSWSSSGSLSQVLAETLQPFTDYVLTVMVGNRLDAPFAGYRVELLAGAVVLAADNNTQIPADGTFTQSTVTFSTGAAHSEVGQALQIRLIGLGHQAAFDFVQLDATVPEPGSAALLALSLGGAFVTQRLRRRGKIAAAEAVA